MGRMRRAARDIEGLDVYAGLDLSEVADLTALVLVRRNVATGEWSASRRFWLRRRASEKSAHDRQLYDVWASRGLLETSPGKTVSYQYVAQYLWRETFAEHGVVKLAFDRYDFRHLKPWLLEAGFSESVIAEKFEEFGQGMKT